MIIGIDPSTRYYAVVCLGDEPNELGKPVLHIARTIGSTKLRSAEERLCVLYDELGVWLRRQQAEEPEPVVWCEAPPVWGGSRSIGQMGAAVFVVRLACYEVGIPYYEIDNQTWKKEVVAKGNADKEAIKTFLCQHFALPLDWQPPDLYDAYAIAVAGLRRLRLDVK